MKSFLAILIIAFSVQLYAQQSIDEKPIQNFYSSCKAEKFSAQNYNNSGIHDFYAKQYERSIEKFNKALEKDHNLCDSYYLIGYSYQMMGEYDKSIESCNTSIEMNPRSISAYIIKAYSNLFMDQTEEAIKNFEKAKEVGSGKIDAYYGLALIKFHDKDYSGALSEINEFERRKQGKIRKKDMKTMIALEKKLESYQNYSMKE